MAAAGCGGGGGRETQSPAEFRAQADAICVDFRTQIDALEEPSSLDEFVEYAGQAIPIIDEGHEELRRLVPPEELASTWNRALDVNDEVLQLTRDLRDAAEEGDQEHAQELVQQVQARDAEAGRLAREVGLEECG